MYRTSDPAAGGEPRFTDRQSTWIETTSSEAEVRANLGGTSIVKAPSTAPDEAMQVMFWLGLAFCLVAGPICLLSEPGALGLFPVVFGVPLLLGALVRRVRAARAAAAPPAIEILAVEPRFEKRVVMDNAGDPIELTMLVVREGRASRELVWPSRLGTLRSTLTESDRVRVGLHRRGHSGPYVVWAYPL